MLMIGIALALGTVLVSWVSFVSGMASRLFDVVAVVAAFMFFVIAADAIRETIVHDTVFMTEVHEVLVNPFFLGAGAYLGPYAIGRLVMLPASLFVRK